MDQTAVPESEEVFGRRARAGQVVSAHHAHADSIHRAEDDNGRYLLGNPLQIPGGAARAEARAREREALRAEGYKVATADSSDRVPPYPLSTRLRPTCSAD